MKNIILVGCAGHAKVVIDIIEKEGKYKIVGLFDNPEKIGTEVYGYKVFDSESNLNKYVSQLRIEGGIVAIGNNWIRKKVVDRILNILPDFEFVTTIHPSVNIGKNVKIGKGCVLIPGVSVNSDAIIKNHCVLNTNSSLGHEAKMEDFSSLSSNATVGGGAEIGECSAIALSATILHGRKVGDHSIIGAGAVVVENIPSKVVAFGTPCKIIKTRSIGENYL